MTLSNTVIPFASTVIGSECVDLVSSEYEKLQGALEGLGKAINGTLGRQKDDLQRTQKSEMRRVQVEIESLAKEKTRLEESIASNQRACQQETERDWYKKEALHLDEVLEQMKFEKKELRDHLDESEQDRKWMKGRVETLTKCNWVLEEKLKELGVDVNALLESEDRENSSSGDEH